MPPPDLAQFVTSAAAVIDVVAPRNYTKDAVGTPWGQPNPNPDEYRLTKATSLIRGAAALPSYTVSAPAPLLGGSEYILFLDRSPAGGFFLDNGFYGAFLIAQGAISFQCPNYDDPAQPIQSSGRKVGVDEFRQMIRAVG